MSRPPAGYTDGAVLNLAAALKAACQTYGARSSPPSLKARTLGRQIGVTVASTITTAVAARIPNRDANVLRYVAERQGTTVSAVVAQFVRAGIARYDVGGVPQLENTMAASSVTRGRAA